MNLPGGDAKVYEKSSRRVFYNNGDQDKEQDTRYINMQRVCELIRMKADKIVNGPRQTN